MLIKLIRKLLELQGILDNFFHGSNLKMADLEKHLYLIGQYIKCGPENRWIMVISRVYLEISNTSCLLELPLDNTHKILGHETM